MTGIEIAAVGAFISALKNLKDLTASLGGEVPREVHDQILDLSERFSGVQLGLLAAQQQAIELTKRCGELDDDLKRVKDWEAERGRYTLQTVGYPGAVAYRPKSPESGSDHYLCPNCFEDAKKSYLQRHGVNLKCPRCAAVISLTGS